MSMNKYYVYRSILSNDPDGHQTWQMIATIEAEDDQIALERAKFIKSFCTWDNKPGIVSNVEECQPECERAAHVPNIIANHYGNESLARQKKLIDDEIESHHRRMSVLQDTYQDMLATM